MLTEKQKQVYQDIVEGMENNNVPTLKELADKYNVTPNAIKGRIDLIEKKGYLKRLEYRKFEILK